MSKSPDAFRTISEVSDWLDTPAHVLRFWESRFTQVKPVKRAGGRRYYRPSDMLLLGGIKRLLHEECITIRGVQKILREKGVRHVAALSPDLDGALDPQAEVTEKEAPSATEGQMHPARGDAREPPPAKTPGTTAPPPERAPGPTGRAGDAPAEPEPATSFDGETAVETNVTAPVASPEDVTEDGLVPKSAPFITRLRDLATIGGTPRGEARDRLQALYIRLQTLRDRAASADGH
ncbi:MAG: MerR family transcriptional regulator [Pseudomonadota bacterium]